MPQSCRLNHSVQSDIILSRRKGLIVDKVKRYALYLPVIAVCGGLLFFLGRAMQGVAAGFIGVVVPMYIAECLGANSRSKGAGMLHLLDFKTGKMPEYPAEIRRI